YWGPSREAELPSDLGLGSTVCLVRGPGREPVATDPATVSRTQDYLRGVIDAAHEVGAGVTAGPAYASVGRTWRMSQSERRECYRELAANLAPVVEHGMSAGVQLAGEPLHRYETSLMNTVDLAT